jgi:hypothetical protein
MNTTPKYIDSHNRIKINGLQYIAHREGVANLIADVAEDGIGAHLDAVDDVSDTLIEWGIGEYANGLDMDDFISWVVYWAETS